MQVISHIAFLAAVAGSRAVMVTETVHDYEYVTAIGQSVSLKDTATGQSTSLAAPVAVVTSSGKSGDAVTIHVVPNVIVSGYYDANNNFIKELQTTVFSTLSQWTEPTGAASNDDASGASSNVDASATALPSWLAAASEIIFNTAGLSNAGSQETPSPAVSPQADSPAPEPVTSQAPSSSPEPVAPSPEPVKASPEPAPTPSPEVTTSPEQHAPAPKESSPEHVAQSTPQVLAKETSQPKPSSTHADPAPKLAMKNAPSSSSPQPQQTSSSISSFAQDILNFHNHVRSIHHAGPLSWDDSLAAYAQNYLNSNNCQFKHSGGPYGENLAIGYNTPDDAMAAWYNEQSQYSYSLAQFTESNGHFTQMVWKSSTSIGCAIRDCSGSQYLVCEYAPHGNVIGRFAENVQ